jgi:hypothetical protein
MVINGHRVADNELRDNPFRPGAYGRVDVGGEQHRWQWWCVTPNGHLGNLDAHDVTEHDDGTITASPSLLIEERRDGIDHELWHGWLERGEWRKC